MRRSGPLPELKLREFALETSPLLKPYYMYFAFALIQTFSQTRFAKLVSSLLIELTLFQV